MMAKLGDLGRIITGNTPKTSEVLNYSSNDICFVKPSDILDGEITKLTKTEFYISEYARPKARILPPKSVLVTCIGIIGKVAINDVECAFNQQINAIIPDFRKCLTEYLGYAIQNKQKEMQDIANAPVVPILNKTQFLEIEVSLPSIEEQVEIVEKINATDKLTSLRKEQLAKMDELVKSRFIEMFGDVKDEEKVTLSDICLIITDGTHQPPKFTTTGIPFLFVSNIVGNTITYDAEKFISQETYDELIKRTPIEIGDVLLSTVGSYGHPAVVKSDKPFCFQRHIAYLKPNKELIDSEYLHGAILSVDVQKQIEERVKGIAQKTLNLSEIRKIKLPLPRIDEQKQFAAFVEQVDKSKFEIQKSLEKLETLKKSLMQKYFG
ncbi:MAG: restriction endonuclease subunit S [Clostridia bacterium]|nr:restriction endonuclease subunit S [Clostridia bacterium]